MKRHFASNNTEKCKSEAEIQCFRMHTSAKLCNLISYFMKMFKRLWPLKMELFKNHGTSEATHLYESISRLQSAILDGSPSWEDVFHINWSWATYCHIPGSDAESQTFCTWIYNRKKKEVNKMRYLEFHKYIIHEGSVIILYLNLTFCNFHTDLPI